MEEQNNKYSRVKDEELFYGWVRWLVLIVGLATLIIMVFIPVVSYLQNPESGTSRVINLVINAMGVASLLLAVHSATESRGYNKEIHSVTSKLEGLSFVQEQNVQRTMDKLEELGRSQQHISSILENNRTTSGGKQSSWEKEDPHGTADP